MMKKKMIEYQIIAQYIKDLHFTIPNPKVFFSLSKDISKYKINVDIKSNQIKEKIIEVELNLFLKPTIEGLEQIKTKIVYSTIIEINGDVSDKAKLEKIILVEVPDKIYPEVRKVFIFLFENSGFKEIKIDEKVDFDKLYSQRNLH